MTRTESGRVLDLDQGADLRVVYAGDAPSNPPEWIVALHPQLILLSVAKRSR